MNPQEYVYQDVKTNIIRKKRPINKAQMRDNVEVFMNWRKNDKKQVQKYFQVSQVRCSDFGTHSFSEYAGCL